MIAEIPPEETPLASLEELPNSLGQEGLTSVRLLQQSASRLMRLMDASVTESDLTQSEAGMGRVESHKIQTAINCADALTQIVSTQVNMLKVLKDLRSAKSGRETGN